MKRFIISVILLAVMTAGCIASVFAVNSVTDRLLGLISQTEQAFVEGDGEACEQCARELMRQWDSFMDFSILINDLGHALEITSSIAEIESFAQEQNEELYAACDRAEAQIEMFREMQTPSFWKIL